MYRFEGERDSEGYSLVELLIVVAIIATLAALVVPSYSEMVYTARVTAAIGDIRQIQFDIDCYLARAGDYPQSLSDAGIDARLDPWGRPYQYLKLTGIKKANTSAARKDKNLVPLNKDYDLYSMGRDGKTKAPITAEASHDDIIRANNGSFIGLATNY